MAAAKTPKIEPEQTELSINYTIGVKANLGNYENSSASVSRSEKWNVAGMTEEEVDEFYNTRYIDIHNELGDLIEAEYKEMLGQ